MDTSVSSGIGFLCGRSCGVAGSLFWLRSSAAIAGMWNSAGSSSSQPSRGGVPCTGEAGRGSTWLRRGFAATCGGGGESARLLRCSSSSRLSIQRACRRLRSSWRPRSASMSSSLRLSSSRSSLYGSGACRTSIGESGRRTSTGESGQYLGGDLGGDLGGVQGGVAGPLLAGVQGGVLGFLLAGWAAGVWLAGVRRGLSVEPLRRSCRRAGE